jgi:hypothetical protein
MPILAGGMLKMGSDLAMARVAAGSWRPRRTQSRRGWGERVFADTRGSREYASLVQQTFKVVEGGGIPGARPAEVGVLSVLALEGRRVERGCGWDVGGMSVMAVVFRESRWPYGM